MSFLIPVVLRIRDENEEDLKQLTRRFSKSEEKEKVGLSNLCFTNLRKDCSTIKKLSKSFSWKSYHMESSSQNINSKKIKENCENSTNVNTKSNFQDSTKPFTNYTTNNNSNSEFIIKSNKLMFKKDILGIKNINTHQNKHDTNELNKEDYDIVKNNDLNEFYNNDNKLEFSFYMDPIKEKDVSYLFSSSKKATINTKIFKPSTHENIQLDKSVIKEDFSISSINSIPSIDISEIAERYYSNKYKINDKINDPTNVSGIRSKRSQSSDIIFNKAVKNYIENILSTREISQLNSDNEIKKIFKRTKSQSFLSISNKILATSSSISKPPKTTTNFHHNKTNEINLLGNILKNHNRYLDGNKWEKTVNKLGDDVISDIYSNSKFNSEDKSKS